MKTRPLGKTGLELPILSFGASSLGAEFRGIDINEAMKAVRVALDCGMTFIDTSPFYGRGMSEVLLGVALEGVPRDRYLLGSKLGRYDAAHFDFSARRVVESVDVSLKRMRVEHLDLCLCHDLEFVEMSQIVNETLPALRKVQAQGKVRFVGVSGYPMKMFQYILANAPIDVLLSYNHYTLQNTMLEGLLPLAKSKGTGVMNAAPFSARLLSNAPLPAWHKATPLVRETARKAALHCANRGSDLAKLAVQFSVGHPDISTCIAGSASPERVAQWATWVDEPVDEALLREVQDILAPIKDWFYIEGRPENNDEPNDRRSPALLAKG
ncbi:MAG TPA: aldo/keto reductase [Planctomycetota bacterium]|nr:aldo/keto reductase [Planctomycetota bacterium]